MRKLLALSLMVALVGGACGSDDKSGSASGDTSASASATASGDESTDPGEDGDGADLSAKLLTEADLPGGFVKSEDDSSSDGGDEEDDELSGCKAADDFDKKYEDTSDDTASVSFERETPSGGQFLEEELDVWDDESDANEVFDAGVDAFKKCATFETVDEDNVKMSATISPASIEKAGDESAAFRLNMTAVDTDDPESQPISFVFYLVVARKGGHLVSITAGSFGDEAVTIADAQAVVEKAVAKL